MADQFNIDRIQGPIAPPSAPKSPAEQKPVGDVFKDVLSKSLNEVQDLQNQAEEAIKQVVSGDLKGSDPLCFKDLLTREPGD